MSAVTVVVIGVVYELVVESPKPVMGDESRREGSATSLSKERKERGSPVTSCGDQVSHGRVDPVKYLGDHSLATWIARGLISHGEGDVPAK